jgi:hypothetical protein
MKLNEFLKVEDHARVVSAWKYLPKWKRKLLRMMFQFEVLRISLPQILLRALAVGVAFVFFIVTPFPRTRPKSAHWI